MGQRSDTEATTGLGSRCLIGSDRIIARTRRSVNALRKVGAFGVAIIVMVSCGSESVEEVDPLAVELAEELFADAGVDELAAAARYEQDRAMAEARARCMSAQGFDYVAYVPEERAATFYAASDGSTYPDDEYVSRYGYGLTLRILDDAEGRSPSDELERSDPNDELYGSLTLSEQDAWDTAYTSCDDDALAAAPAVERNASIFAILADDLAQVPERVMSDARMVDFLADWQVCMSGFGWDVSTPDEVDALVFNLLEANVPLTDDMDRIVDALNQVMQMEADLARDDLECGGGVAATKLYETIEREYQILVVDRNLSDVRDVADVN